MWELLAKGKNTTDPEVIDPGGRSVEDSPVKSDFTFTFNEWPASMCNVINNWGYWFLSNCGKISELDFLWELFYE
jgi:hypothetical protein